VIGIPLKHWRRYAALSELQPAFEFLEKHADGSGLGLGRHPIDGDRVYALVVDVELKPPAECRFETHRHHTDVIYLVKGSETIGYAPVDALGPQVEYDSEKDTAFYRNPAEHTSIGLEAQGMVCVFYPEDGHMPAGLHKTDTQARKVIVKVRATPLD